MDAALFQEPRRRMFTLPDGEMAALEFGDPARPLDLVFLHANGFNAMTYRSILAPLSLGMRVLAVDQRGHGASRLPIDPRGRRSWADLRDDLIALLETLGCGRVRLAGHSMGATVALMAAAERPDLVAGLVLFEPVIFSRLVSLYARAPWTSGRLWRRMPLARRAARRRSVFASASEAFCAYKGRGAFRTWPEIMLADYVAAGFTARADGCVELACDPQWEASNYAAQANDPWSALARTRCPVTIYRAEHRSFCQLGAGRTAVRKNPRLKVHTVAAASHFLPMERVEVVRDALLDAVDR